MKGKLLDGYTDTEYARGTDALLADLEAHNASQPADRREGAWTDTLGMPVMLAGDGLPVAQSDCEM
jgi:hypothetical protein